jgi:cobalamin biosynthesis protein CobD/CbiB
MLQQTTDVAKQRFQLYFELYTRSKQFLNRVMEKKNQLDIQSNQLAIAISAKTLDKSLGGTTEYRLEDVDGMLKELQFSNMKEQVRVEMNAEDIRKKLQTNAALNQPEP